MLEKYEEDKNEMLKQHKAAYMALREENEEKTRQEMEAYEEKMKSELINQEKIMNDKLANIHADNIAEKEKIQNEFTNQKSELKNQLATMQKQMTEANERQKQQQADMMKIIEKKNYEEHYPMPSVLASKLLPETFAMQVLGCRGAGKSTFVNKFLKKTNNKEEEAAVGAVECTTETRFFDITSSVTNKPERYDKEGVFKV